MAQQLRGCGGRKVTGGTTGEQVAQQQVRYASGRVVSVMSSAFTGEGKTDAKDGHVIAETARLRRDLSVVDQVSDLARNLAVLTAHRADLVADRVRGINRLRDLLTSVFPALEREFDYASCKGALVLVAGYATPDRLRRVGRARLAAWLRARHVRSYAQLADRAVTAAGTQRVVVPGQDTLRRDRVRTRQQRPGSGRPHQGRRRSDRRDLRAAPAGRHHRLDARVRPVPRCVAGGRRR